MTGNVETNSADNTQKLEDIRKQFYNNELSENDTVIKFRAFLLNTFPQRYAKNPDELEKTANDWVSTMKMGKAALQVSNEAFTSITNSSEADNEQQPELTQTLLLQPDSDNIINEQINALRKQYYNNVISKSDLILQLRPLLIKLGHLDEKLMEHLVNADKRVKESLAAQSPAVTSLSSISSIEPTITDLNSNTKKIQEEVDNYLNPPAPTSSSFLFDALYNITFLGGVATFIVGCILGQPWVSGSGALLILGGAYGLGFFDSKPKLNDHTFDTLTSSYP